MGWRCLNTEDACDTEAKAGVNASSTVANTADIICIVETIRITHHHHQDKMILFLLLMLPPLSIWLSFWEERMGE